MNRDPGGIKVPLSKGDQTCHANIQKGKETMILTRKTQGGKNHRDKRSFHYVSRVKMAPTDANTHFSFFSSLCMFLVHGVSRILALLL